MTTDIFWAVYRLSLVTSDFELVGVFTKKDDAEEFREARSELDFKGVVVARTLSDIVDGQIEARLAVLGLKVSLEQATA